MEPWGSIAEVGGGRNHDGLPQASTPSQGLTVEEMKAAKTWELFPAAGEWMFEGQKLSMSNAPFQHFWC